jgi:hypothetical protein
MTESSSSFQSWRRGQRLNFEWRGYLASRNVEATATENCLNNTVLCRPNFQVTSDRGVVKRTNLSHGGTHVPRIYIILVSQFTRSYAMPLHFDPPNSFIRPKFAPILAPPIMASFGLAEPNCTDIRCWSSSKTTVCPSLSHLIEILYPSPTSQNLIPRARLCGLLDNHLRAPPKI